MVLEIWQNVLFIKSIIKIKIIMSNTLNNLSSANTYALKLQVL